MAKSYEESLEVLNDNGTLDEEDWARAESAMSFVLSIHNMLLENGALLGTDPDVSLLENCIDGVFAELAAACILLTSEPFSKVDIPGTLVKIAGSIPLKDSEKDVPEVVRRGFLQLSKRLKASSRQMSSAKAALEQ